METTTIRDRVFDRSALHSPGNGRDYLKTPEGEIFSINGLYCNGRGDIDRYGSHVKVIDIRWTVVVWQDCTVGLNPDFSYKTERRLIFAGDVTDEAILARYGYRMERDAEGYRNIKEVTR